MARIRFGRGLFLGLPERLQDRSPNELRPTAGTCGSHKFQSACQLIVYFNQE